jgi:acetoin utilization deacetylase AcuC-like enzyme
MKVVHHPDQARHDPALVYRTGKFVDQPDRAERYRVLLDAARAQGHALVEASLTGLDPILEIHDAAYVRFLQTAHARWAAHPGYGPEAVPNVHPTHRMFRKPTELLGELGWYSNSTSCPITAGAWPSAYASAQSAIGGADIVAASGETVYALCRPPGHHAYPDLMTGVCFLNNAAIAAHRLTKRYAKVAIVDLDVHHGNGTQHIFWTRPDVLFCSLHVDPRLAAPYYAGYADEIGEGQGKGLTFNLPLPWGTTDHPWLEALDTALARIRAFEPGALVVSLGFDASEHDPLATFKVTHDGFNQAGRRLASLGSPTLLVQEGGYSSARLGACLRSFLSAFDSRAE